MALLACKKGETYFTGRYIQANSLPQLGISTLCDILVQMFRCGRDMIRNLRVRIMIFQILLNKFCT
jgi:hypothetical protein